MNLAIRLKLLFQLIRKIEYTAQPIAAPNIHKSPEVNLKLIKYAKSPLQIIVKTPKRHIIKPKILDRFILSLKNKTESNIIKIGVSNILKIVKIFGIVKLMSSPPLLLLVLLHQYTQCCRLRANLLQALNPKRENFMRVLPFTHQFLVSLSQRLH